MQPNNITILSTNNVLVSPGGEIQYCKPLIINRYNPYLNYPNDSITEEYRDIEANGEIISIPVSNYDLAVELHESSSVVRFFCMVDFLLNGTFYTNQYYGSFYNIFVACFSFIGFYSTYFYSKAGIYGYLLYTYIQSFNKSFELIVYISAYLSYETYIQMKKSKVFYTEPIFEDLLIVIISLITRIYITHYIQRFYDILPIHYIPI